MPRHETATSIATLAVPAGSYVIWAKLHVNGAAAGSFTAGADCTLSAGADTDTSRIQAQSTGGADLDIPMALGLDHVAAAPETIT